MKGTKAVDWLLEEDQPSIRYLTLTQILGRPEDDPEVRTAREKIPKKGWAADILAKQDPRGYWERKLKIQLQGRTPDSRGGFTPVARSYMHLGKREEALQMLEKAYQVRDTRLMFWLPAFEEFDALRSEPRFQKLLHDLGIS